MTLNRTSRMVTATILSMSLLTVMAAAAIAPAMGVIRQHFSSSSHMTVQLMISLPALFIIMTNLVFAQISRVLKTRSIALIGLALYVVSGTGCFFIDNLYALLAMRALLGVSVGLVMPLSTGLLAFLYPPQEQARLMGLSAAMNQMGGVVGMLLSGILASVAWNYSFLVYLFGLVALLMVLRWLPDIRLASDSGGGHAFDLSLLRRFHPSVVGMLLLTMVFFVFPTNFAIITGRQLGLDTTAVTLLMVALDILAFFAGVLFGRLMRQFRTTIKFFPPVALIIGFSMYAAAHDMTVILLGSLFIALANGVGVPYLMTIGSIKGGKNAATTVMPLLSASLYLGQFLSPVIILSLSGVLFGIDDIVGPYKVAVIISAVFLVQVWCTRKSQSLPPR